MARTNNLTNFLTDVAGAIKTKTGDNSLIPASQFDTKIAGITTGKLSNEEYTKANNDLDKILYQSQNVLPDTYQEVEYLESTGTQYIDTGYTFTNPNFKIELKYQKNTSLATNVFGVDTRVAPRQMHGNIYNRTFYLGNSSVVNNVTQELNTDYDYTVIFNENGAYFKLNENEYSYTGTTAWNGASLSDYLFTSHQTEAGGTLYNMKGRIYYARFYNENNVIVRNFIPCYRKSDDKPGMYDTINNVFYTNDGTGEFAVGEDVDVLNTKIESVLTEKNTKILPENIKKDVNILGVLGTYEGSSSFPPDWSELGYSETPQNILYDFDYSKDIKDNWNSGATSLASKFSYNTTLKYMPLVDTSNATNMNSMFEGCSNLLKVALLDTSKVTRMQSMFAYCGLLTTIPQFDTSEVTTMFSMFESCTKLKAIPQIDTQNVDSTFVMFRDCSNLEDVPVLNTAKVTTILNMFTGCSSLSNDSLNNIMQMCIGAIKYTGTKTLKEIGLTSAQATTCQSLSNYQAFLDAGWSTGY